METNSTTWTEADAGHPVAILDGPAMASISRSIWQMTEEFLELLRTGSTDAVRKQKSPDLLWVDDLTEAQSNTVIAVRQLCHTCPEGVALKKLAEMMGVTPAAASVMVDLLVKKKMLKRTRSKNDRRAVLIRLTPQISNLFDISDQSLLQTFTNLHDSLGPQFLYDWQKTLQTATGALRQVLGLTAHDEPDELVEPVDRATC
jgi:DNA-binding MarR family transcriptional regulator